MSQRITTSTDAPAISDRAVRVGTGCIASVFALGFLGIGGVAFYLLTLRPVYDMVRASSWGATPCTVVSSKLDGDGDSDRVEVVFKYTVEKREHQSNRYCFVVLTSNTGRDWKNQVIQDHPTGKQTTCFVNPGDPNEAVIERGWVPEMWWGLFPLPFLVVGSVALLIAKGTIRIPRSPLSAIKIKWKPATTQNLTLANVQANDSPLSDRDSNSAGPVILKPPSTPFEKFLEAIVFTCIWNGVVSVFAQIILDDLRHGRIAGWAWLKVAFVLQFVLVGVGLVGYVFYTFLKLFNPRPSLTVNSAAIPLGGPLRLSWTLTGRIGSIRQFTILLKGVEKATYLCGTSTSTDIKTFAEIRIYETSEMFEMAQGSAEIRVPAGIMHTFHAPNNEIVWTLEVHGEISFWPDVAASFPITILPQPLRAGDDT